MGFGTESWLQKLAARWRAWRLPPAEGRAVSLYGAMCGAALAPVMEAARAGEPMAAGAALFALAGSVGANLLANQVQRLADRSAGDDEAAAAAWAAEIAPRDPAVRDALDTLLEKLEAVTQIQAALAEAQDERARFEAELREELRALGNLERFAGLLGGGASVSVGRDVKDSVVVAGSHNQVHGGTGHQFQMGPGSQVVFGGPAASDAARALAAYREWLLAHHTRLLLPALDRGAGDPAGGENLGLAEIYVDLDTTTVDEAPRAKRRGRDKPASPSGRELERRPLSALAALLRERRVVLLGDPGSGKSTFLKFVTLCLAAHAQAPDAGWLERLPGWPAADADMLPVPVVLRDFARRRPQREDGPVARDLWDFIVQCLEADCGGAAAQPLQAALDAGRAVVFLDGLDEVPGDTERAEVRDAVSAFAERYKRSRFVVTCRTLSYQDPAWRLAGWPAFTLAPFDDERIQRFIGAWHGELAKLGRLSSADSREQAAALAAAVQRPGLRDLAPNPLLLTQMALVHRHRGRLPDARAQLYKETVDLLLWSWDQARLGEKAQVSLRAVVQQAQVSDIDLLGKLRELAFGVHGERGDGGLADIPEARLEQALRRLHPDSKRNRDWAASVVETIQQRAGLLLERAPGVYAFPHRTFQEYLAGCHLAVQTDFASQAARLLGEGAFWREVVLLAVGELVAQGDKHKPLALVEELCPETEPADDVAARRAWDAGEVLAELGVQRVAELKAGPRLTQSVRQGLRAVVERGLLEPVERVAAGYTLGRVGDPRFRADAWHLPDDPLLGFVEIPAGPFMMGSDDERDSVLFDAKPAHRVELPAYFIGRYPVTVAQFRAYVEDVGAAEGAERLERALRGPVNHPVRVTWDEALAYTRWLTERLRAWDQTPERLAKVLRGERGWSVRLASEAEWEKGARGGDARPYPWGVEEPDPSRANYAETGIGGTSAVGCFPRGASPYEVEDLSGNVWEWTRSVPRPYPYVSQDGREDLSTPGSEGRAVRGGAFHSNATGVRAAVRRGVIHAYDSSGFRVVVSPFTSGL